MKPETASWLDPMMKTLEDRPEIDIHRLFKAASMPASESCDPIAELVTRVSDEFNGQAPTGLAINWVMFGQLLRQELRWDDYPEWPEGPFVPGVCP